MGEVQTRSAAGEGPSAGGRYFALLNALKGLPGPYVKWFLDKTSHEGLNNLLTAYKDKTAYGQCIFAYSSGAPDEEPKLFVGKARDTIVTARGKIDKVVWNAVSSRKSMRSHTQRCTRPL